MKEDAQVVSRDPSVQLHGRWCRLLRQGRREDMGIRSKESGNPEFRIVGAESPVV